jgi:RimJ/RimL family protein N-acetyltransferase
VRSIVAHIHPEHTASAQVATAIGMRPTSRWHEGEVRWVLARE